MNFEELQARIRSVRGAIRRLFLLDGAGKVLLIASGFCAFLFLADYTLHLPAAARTILFLLSLTLVAAAFARFLAYPLRTPITDDDVVLCVERTHPDLKESLISALQFHRYRDETGGKIMSSAMVAATVRQALSAAAPLAFRGVLAPGPSLRKFFLGAAGAAVLLGAGAIHPRTSLIFLNRVYGGSTPWPTRTHIIVEAPESENTRIAAGEDLQVKVKIRGVVPSRVWIYFHFKATGERGEARMMKVGDHAFQFVFSRLVSPLACRIEAGDASPKTFEVDVLQPPRVKRIRLWLQPPEYTKLPPTPALAPLTDGNIRAPVGSKARLRVDVSKPVESARMVFQPSGTFRDLPRVGLQVVEAEFDVVLDARYALKIVDTEGLENRTPSRFSIRALKDRPPRISVARPESTSLWITPQATLPFLFTVKDDFGVQTVVLFIVRGDREHGPKEISLSPTTPLLKGEKKWGPRSAGFVAVVDFSSMDIPGEDGERKIEEGDLVLAFVEATDFRRPKPNRTPSAEYRLTVVSRGKLERLVEERMIQIKDRLRQARDSQEKVRADLDEVRGVLEIEEVWDRADREKLLGCQTGQRAVAQRLMTAAREFDRVLATVKVNNLGDPEYQRKIEDMGGITRHLSEERCSDALAGMEFARSASVKEDQQKGVSEALHIQADVLQALEDLLKRMEKWEDYNEVIKMVREIRDRQRSVLEETRKAAEEKEKEREKKKK